VANAPAYGERALGNPGAATPTFPPPLDGKITQTGPPPGFFVKRIPVLRPSGQLKLAKALPALLCERVPPLFNRDVDDSFSSTFLL
ncbi:hypothetical protein, partial [Microbulbifer halophilus]